MKKVDVVIIGAGISGLGAAFELKKRNINYLILEKNASYGGLLDNFEIDGFLFDNFVHFSFCKDPKLNQILLESTPYNTLFADPINFFKNVWIKHPAITNLFPLDENTKHLVIESFKNRDTSIVIKNYEDWLNFNYGAYFTEHFVEKYTKKYWTVSTKELSLDWIGKRMIAPKLDDILEGSIKERENKDYYLNELRYPKNGGFKNFLNTLPKENIIYNSTVLDIDIDSKIIKTNNINYSAISYDKIISSIPLPEYSDILNTPVHINSEIQKLNHTSGYLLSLGFSNKKFVDKLWYYIYDENFLTSRVYSPSLKSNNNAPNNCSSIQAEIYTNKGSEKYSENELNEEVTRLSFIHGYHEKDILVKDIRFNKYANVIFDHNSYASRKIIIDFLESNSIIPCGRFGEWEYFWSHQSLESGILKAKKIHKV
ncbi:NAD(P)-binding protein [Flavobacteriaceae bacterium]|nr:NAD(P)-binding protein [Flavobacteriaceae bacterium]